MIKPIFSASLQRVTEHELTVDDNNEIVARCLETGSELKFPNVSEVEFNQLIEKHELSNKGQIVKKPLFGGTEAQPEVANDVQTETETKE